MTPDRFDHDADPTGSDRPVHPDIDRHDLDPNAYRIVRIPDHTTLARIRYRRDPFFAEAVNVAYKWLDRAGTPEEVFDRYAGKRLRITRNLLDGGYYGGDVEPFVGVVTDDDRVEGLLDWVDDPASSYARRDAPASIDGAKADADDSTFEQIEEAEEAWRNGDVTRAQFEAFVADIVDADPVSTPEGRGLNAEDTAAPVDMSWYDVARAVAVGTFVLILIAGAIYFFV